MPIIDTILAKAKATDEHLEEQKQGGFIYVLFFDVENRETFLIECHMEDISQTRENLQRMLDDGARPVCLLVLLIQKPTFVELDNGLAVEDRAIIGGWMEGGTYSLIARRRDRPSEN